MAVLEELYKYRHTYIFSFTIRRRSELTEGRIMSVQIQYIPRYVFDELHALIGENTKEKLLKYVLTDRTEEAKTAVDTYIRNIFNEIFFSEDDIVDLLQIKDTYRRRRQLTKKNWYKQLKKEVEEQNHSPIHDELESLKKIMESTHSNEKFKSTFKNIDEPAKYIQSRLDDIQAWAIDRDTRLTDYSYLETKKQYQIVKAFENDIVYIICDFLKRSPKNWISHRFKDLIENPVFTDGKAKLKGNVKFDSENNQTIVYDDYKLSDERIIRSFISIQENEEIELDKMFFLDDTDSEILEHIIEQRDKRFYTDKTIVFDMSPLLTRVYGDTSQKAYDLATKRLNKIRRFSIEGRKTSSDKEVKTTFFYNLFQKVEVTKDEVTGRVYAELQFSDDLHQQFITKQTVQIYSHFIHRLESRLSKILIYALQKERLDAYLQERKMKDHFDYTFFSDRIRFRSKRIDANLKQIESSLQEFKYGDILIEDYQRTGNAFEITLKPLSESEKQDFFSPTNSTLLD